MNKVSKNLISWIETTIEKICQDKGCGRICVTWHIKDGKLDGTEKRFIQTEKESNMQTKQRVYEDKNCLYHPDRRICDYSSWNDTVYNRINS